MSDADSDALTPEQAATLLGVSGRTVWRWIKDGKLAGTRQPCLTTRTAVNALLRERQPPCDAIPHEKPDGAPLRNGHGAQGAVRQAMEEALSGLSGPARPPARMGVYAITHVPTGRTYIGSSLDIDARIRDHRAHLVRGRHANRRLQQDWTCDGPGGFRWSTRDYAESEEELPVLEQQWIGAVRPYYNQRQTAGRAKTRLARRSVSRPAATHPRPAVATEAVVTLAEQVERLAIQVGQLGAELAQARTEALRLEAELAQCRRQATGDGRQNAQRAGVLRRVGLWLRKRR